MDFILETCLKNQKALITYANVHAVNLAGKIPWFKNFMNQADIVFCDGFGVKWAAEFLYGAKLYRHTPPDWFHILAKKCVDQGITFYFLGAKQGIAQKVALQLRNEIPGLKIIGFHHGYILSEENRKEQEYILAEINRLRPNILVLGMGMPFQEQWAMENWDQLKVNIVFPAGALFDYLSGEIYRVPKWMTDHGLEWLGRLIIEPGRLWKRYLFGNLVFVIRVLQTKLTLRFKK